MRVFFDKKHLVKKYEIWGDGHPLTGAGHGTENCDEVTVIESCKGLVLTMLRYNDTKSTTINLYGASAIKNKYTEDQFKLILENCMTILEINSEKEKFVINDYPPNFIADKTTITENGKTLRTVASKIGLTLDE
jgi:hypothetical protein